MWIGCVRNGNRTRRELGARPSRQPLYLYISVRLVASRLNLNDYPGFLVKILPIVLPILFFKAQGASYF